MKKHLVLFSVMMMSSLTLVSCNNQPSEKPVVETISLKEIIVVPPTKREYRPKENLDLTGMVVKAVFSDGSTQALEQNEYQVSGFSSETPGKCVVTISYTKDEVTKSDSFEVTILEEEYRPMSLYQSDSKMYLTSIEEKSTFSLMTYHHKDFGDAPYVEMEQLMIPYFSFAEYARNFERSGDGVYKITRPSGDKNGSIVFDTKKQEITITNAAGIYSDLFGMNNGFGDYGSGAKLIRGSSKTKMVKEGTPRVIKLSDYGYRIESQDGRLYVPASLLGGLLFAPATSGFTYNGHDYFVRQSLENMDVSPLAFSSSRGFALVSAGGTVKQSYKKVATQNEDEAYRYEAKYNVGDKDIKIDLVLKKDGTGSALSNDTGILKVVDLYIKWSEDGDIISMDIDKMMMGEPLGSPRHIKVRNDDSTYFGLKERSESIALDNYRGLCFDLDLNFGLKGFKEITTFDQYFTSTGRKDALLSKDPETYQDAVARLIYTDFDEMHSSAIDQSYFGDFDQGTYFSSKANDSEGHTGYMGARNRAFITEIQRLALLYEKAENKRENYEVYNDLAVLKFDNFYYKDAVAYNDNSYKTEDYETAQKEYFKGWSNQNTYKSFAIAFNDIEKNGNIKNIVIDISLNTGGEVRVMPLLSAFYNRDPSLLIKNNIDGSIIDLHYEADLNGDGEYATESDSFEGKYNFYFMTGGVSFSCGNAFPTMAKNSKKAKIIGEISGGGSCMVDAFVTLDGLTFNTSSPYQFMLDNGDGTYVYNENGVPLDYAYSLDDAYNMAKLSTFIKGLTNN